MDPGGFWISLNAPSALGTFKCASAAAGLLPLRSSLRLGQRGRGGGFAGLWTGGPATEGRVFTDSMSDDREEGLCLPAL